MIFVLWYYGKSNTLTPLFFHQCSRVCQRSYVQDSMSLTTWSVECDYESPLKGRLFQNRDTPLHVDADITKLRKNFIFLPNVPNIFPCRLRFSISIHLAKTSARGIETRVGFFRVVRSRIRLSRIFTSCFSVCADM